MTLHSVEIDDDAPVTNPADLGTPPIEPTESDSDPFMCEVCGAPVPRTPTGRKPRVMLCEEHRKSTPSTGTGKRAGGSHAKIAEGMAALHNMLGFGLGMVAIPTRDPVWQQDGKILSGRAEDIGEAWAKFCDTNPKARKSIEKFLEGAGTLSLIGAYAPVAIGIGMNHRTAMAGKHEGVK